MPEETMSGHSVHVLRSQRARARAARARTSTTTQGPQIEKVNLPPANGLSAQHNQLATQAGASAAIKICVCRSCWLRMRP